jgi:hypothetical protein
MELVETAQSELPASPEKPHTTAIVTLPDIDALGTRVKLGIHTDSTLTLIRTLSQQPDRDQLRIEGRVLTPVQRERLEQHPIYRFFLSSRVRRAMSGGMFLVLPTELYVTPDNIAAWIQTTFSPDTLAQELGYTVGYYDAAGLVDRWQTEGRPNDFLPLFGGVNQFAIGSDTLSQERIRQIAGRLRAAFEEQERQARLAPPLTNAQLNLYTSYSLINPSNSGNIISKQDTKKLNNLSISKFSKLSENTYHSLNDKLIRKKY